MRVAKARSVSSTSTAAAPASSPRPGHRSMNRFGGPHRPGHQDDLLGKRGSGRRRLDRRAKLDGSAGGSSEHRSAGTLIDPYKIGLDPVNGRVYWGNNPKAKTSRSATPTPTARVVAPSLSRPRKRLRFRRGSRWRSALSGPKETGQVRLHGPSRRRCRHPRHLGRGRRRLIWICD